MKIQKKFLQQHRTQIQSQIDNHEEINEQKSPEQVKRFL